MRLSALAEAVPHRQVGSGDPEVSAVTHDSRRAAPGALFAAFDGTRLDGRAFLGDAVGRGAVAALGLAPAPAALAVPYLEVESPRRAAGLLASRLHGEPSERLVMAGVTGTSGKTTTTLLLDAVLGTRHRKRGLFGTLVYRAAGGDAAALEASRTTPEATDLQPMLAALAAEGGTAATMECSSHALVLERLAGCRFDVAVFLNLSRDHLDFHGDLDTYFEAKARLFGLLKPSAMAVVNAADPYGRRLLARLPSGRRVSFSLDGEADVRAVASFSNTGTRLEVTVPRTGSAFTVSSPLLGRPNAENLLAAAAAGLALGVPGDEIAHALGSVAAIPGRLERIENGLGITVLVDYAHKPGALEGVLATVRPIAETAGGRVVVVFGCGGERDRGKRPEMGAIAARLADVVVVTSDNPRGEDPGAILDEIRPGVESVAGGAARALFVTDRRAAVAAALERARRGDVVLLAGKGHETYQEMNGRREPFDDREVARAELRRREGS